MRADLLTPVVEAAPGASVHLELEVLNNGTIIDEVRCELPGLGPGEFTQSPSSLRLFPGEHGRVELLVHVPLDLHAGPHAQAVKVQGTASGDVVEREARLDIKPFVKPTLCVTPLVRTGGRRGRFTVEVGNRGNTDLDLTVSATDTNQLLKVQLGQTRLQVPAGEVVTTELTVGRRRRLFGPPVLHPVQVQVEQLPHVLDTEVQFRQKPRVPSGALTAAALVLIVALWAVAVMFGVKAAMSTPPPKKLVPAGFEKGVDPSTLDVALVGSPVAGKVLNAITGLPLPRLTVELFDAKGRLVAATSSGDDGAWTVPSVLPGPYTVRFRGDGFADLWYPSAPDASGAQPLKVKAGEPLTGIDATVAGNAGALDGLVVAGDGSGGAVTVTIEAVDADDVHREGFPRTVSATAGSAFHVTDLPSPATYRVRVAASGFQSQEVQQLVPAGATVQLNTMRLVAAAGLLSGTVVDSAGAPLGDVAVTTKVDGKDVKGLTPTSGTVGQFRLDGLPTPGTYVVSVAKAGYATEVVAVRLEAGQERTDVNVTLVAATGTVTGVVRGSDGAGIGGVKVAVLGGAAEITTTTFTSGTVGAYRLSGLTLPGTYTISFAADGFIGRTMQVTVAKDRTDVAGDITLTPSRGGIAGLVLAPNAEPIGAATIEVSDGSDVRTTVTATTPADAVGTFSLPDVAPGSYTVTVKAPGYRDQTLLVRVEAGATVQRTVNLVGVSA